MLVARRMCDYFADLWHFARKWLFVWQEVLYRSSNRHFCVICQTSKGSKVLAIIELISHRHCVAISVYFQPDLKNTRRTDPSLKGPDTAVSSSMLSLTLIPLYLVSLDSWTGSISSLIWRIREGPILVWKDRSFSYYSNQVQSNWCRTGPISSPLWALLFFVNHQKGSKNGEGSHASKCSILFLTISITRSITINFIATANEYEWWEFKSRLGKAEKKNWVDWTQQNECCGNTN